MSAFSAETHYHQILLLVWIQQLHHFMQTHYLSRHQKHSNTAKHCRISASLPTLTCSHTN